MQQTPTELVTAFRSFPYFRKLKDEEFQKLCDSSKIQSMNRGDIVLGLGVGRADHVYFVLRGECAVLHLLREDRHPSGPLKGDLLRVDPGSEVAPAVTGVAQLSILHAGATFNLGCELTTADRCVVCRGPRSGQLLLVPRTALLACPADNVWTRLRELLKDRICTEPEMLRRMLRQELAWRRHSKRLVTMALTRHA